MNPTQPGNNELLNGLLKRQAEEADQLQKAAAKTSGTAVEVIPSKATALSLLGFSTAECGLAEYFEVDLSASIDLQMERCRHDAADGLRATIRLGLRLMAIKASAEHGSFEDKVAALDMPSHAAQRAMRLAKSFATAGDQRRTDMLLGMGQTKALSFLAADPEVQTQIAEDPVLLREAFEGKSREFDRRLKALTEQNERLRRKVETAELQAEAKMAPDRIVVPSLPHAIADIRRELAALHEKARLAAQDLADLAQPLLDAASQAGGDASIWVDPTSNQVLIAMRSLHAQLGAQIDQWADYFGLAADAPLPTAEDRAYYRREEAEMVQRHFNTLLTLHASEKVKRENRAHNERARGRKRADV